MLEQIFGKEKGSDLVKIEKGMVPFLTNASGLATIEAEIISERKDAV